MAVLSAIPIPEQANPLNIEDMELARRLAVELCGDERVLLHGGVQPTVGPPGLQIDGMSLLVRRAPDRGVEDLHARARAGLVARRPRRGRAAGRERVPRPRRGDRAATSCACTRASRAGAEYASPVDIGPAARAHPDVRFVVYHSGFESAGDGGPVHRGDRGPGREPADHARCGRPASVRAANVYAELGSTWWVLMREPDPGRARARQAAASRSGPTAILWGTDSLWYGSPQDQIQAFRAFEIATELQEQYGYPALTPEIKRKILGENAIALYGVDEVPDKCTFTRDELATLRVSMPTPWRTYGPSTDAPARRAARRPRHGLRRARDAATPIAIGGDRRPQPPVPRAGARGRGRRRRRGRRATPSTSSRTPATASA